MNRLPPLAIVLRITALWAFSEAFLGGVLHGLKVPFAGLFLSFVASVCITVIAASTTKPGEILKATLLVMAAKFMLSPHTPPMAYVAVFIQGVAGEIIFMGRKSGSAGAFGLTLFSLLYSAFQHLLILTILFGKKGWEAMDIFLNKITQTFIKGSHSYSIYLVVFYLSCYLIAGIIGGIINVKTLRKIQSDVSSDELLLLAQTKAAVGFDPGAKKHRWRFLNIVGGAMFLILIATYFLFSKDIAGNATLQIILRAAIIFVAWVLFITPLLRFLIDRWMKNYTKKQQGALQKIISLMPEIRSIINISRQNALKEKGIGRVKKFITSAILLVVYYEQ